MCRSAVHIFYLAQQPASGPGPPHSRDFQITHNDAPQSVELLWTWNQLVAETSTRQHTTHNRQPQSQQVLHFRRRGHWDRRETISNR